MINHIICATSLKAIEIVISRLISTCVCVTSILFSSALLADGHQAEATTYDLHYQVQWGDTSLGTATAQWRFDETSYEFKGQMKTEGTLSFFYDFKGENTLTGEMIDGRYRPSHFTSQSVFDDETYLIDMSWPKGIQTPIYTVEPEKEKGETHPLRRATLRNVVDPYTAMLMGLADLAANGTCDGSYRVFDGRRRSELLLKDFGTTELVADQDWSYGGPAHICGAASKLIGGHKIDSNYDPDEALDYEKVQIFIAKPDGKTLMPVRIDMNSFLGAITVRLDMDKSGLR